MHSTSQFLLTLGGILLLGLLTSTLGQRSFLPRVTLLLIFGVIIGKDMLDIVPPAFYDWFEVIADMALLMVGFLIGGRLTRKSLRQSAGKVWWISISAAVGTAVIVGLGLVWVGVPEEIAILLGCIAAATAPAAVLDVVVEKGAKTPFTGLLLSVVALDDVWALLLFGIGMAVAASLSSHAGDISVLMTAGREIGGAVVLGLVMGLPAAYLTGRIKLGQPMLTEALGLVFLCGGLAIWLEVSFLIASISMGVVITNLAHHHKYPFHAIEGVEWPFLVIFFILAGASLEVSALREIGMVALVYIVCRSAGKLIGARVGCQLSSASHVTKGWMGAALLPQAGVATGMALVASNQFPEYRQVLLPVVISSTVFFEIIGSVFTRLAIERAEKT